MCSASSRAVRSLSATAVTRKLGRMAEAIRFMTTSATIEVPRKKAEELVAWLRHREDDKTTADAIENALPAGVELTDAQKDVVVRVLRGQLILTGGFRRVGPDLRDLELELSRDLGLLDTARRPG